MRVKKGFTLIEIVVSLAIIGIMMIPLANSLIMSVKANKMGEIAQESKNISQEIVEGLRSLGDVATGTLNIGSNNEAVVIEKVTGTEGKYTVDGVVDDITLSGTIEKTLKGGTIEYESDTYLEENVGIAFYAYKDESETDKNKNKIIYSYDLVDVPMKEHIKRIEDVLGGATNDKVKELKDGDKIHFDFIKPGECSHNNIKHTVLIDDNYKVTDTDGDTTVVEKFNCIKTEEKTVGILVKDIRIGDDTTTPDDDGISPFIGLKVDSKLGASEKRRLLFFNNSFIEAEDGRIINDSVEDGEIVDSFDESKFIGEYIDVIDNIRYVSPEEVNNKGLYTIKLKTTNNRNHVTENTISEFIVSD